MEENLNVVDATQESVVDSPQEEQVTESIEQAINADSGEVATPKVEEKPVQTAEENAKYAQVRREAEQKAYAKAQDELIANMYGESHGIYTKSDYDKAVQAAQEQARIDEYVQNNIPEEYARELVESKKFREQFESERQSKAQQEAKQADYMDFLTAYPDIKPEEIASEVWEATNKGIPLKIAYAAQQENATLKAKLAEYKAKFKAQETNQSNASSSTGSVTGNGIADLGFISYDNFEANKSNSEWVKKNFTKIQESRAKW